MFKNPLSQEREQYWASVLNLMISTFLQGKFFFPQIQKVFNDNIAKIISLYPKHRQAPPKFIFHRQSLNAFNNKDLAPMGCKLVEGELSLGFFLPDIEFMDKVIRAEKHDLDKMDPVVRTALTIKFMHEFDHMALQVIGDDISDTTDGERLVWAKTTQDTISVFTEICRQELCFSDNLFYTNWLECDRNAQSPQWCEFIAGIYGHLRKKPGAQ